ncbi:hypothetical protein [Acidiphilium sp. C61]|uniref:hypothetical protein n=1 Tax=Acidiphilium sp. C61 TaxID=1671485 RepID=UPI00157B2553|nr:hypothetical protein [Acidiphilium sp. C61]
MSIFSEIPRDDPRRRVLRRCEWPAIDERLFAHGCTPAYVFDEDARLGAEWAEPTLKKVVGSYGRWLGFLAETGELDPDIHPADRVIAPRVRGYLALLREVGLSDFSIVGLFADLRTALRVMAPERDFAWLTNPCGASLRSRLPMKRRDFEVPTSLILYEWGVELMLGALDLRGDVRRRVQYRDGLLIAIFAARARRHRAMAGLRLGREVIRHGDAYRGSSSRPTSSRAARSETNGTSSRFLPHSPPTSTAISRSSARNCSPARYTTRSGSTGTGRRSATAASTSASAGCQ